MSEGIRLSSEDWETYDPDLAERADDISEYEQADQSLSLGKLHSTPSDFTKFAIRMPSKKENSVIPFSFQGRTYLIRCYDTPSRRTLYKFGRQCEKSVQENTEVLKDDGSTCKIKDIQVGSRISSLDLTTKKTGLSPIIWKSQRYQKNCLRIRTRKGDVIDAGVTHPFLKIGEWVEAKDLHVGDRIATTRRAGTFSTTVAGWEEDDLVSFCGYMLGDGSCGSAGNFGLTQSRTSPVYADFLAICRRRGWVVREGPQEDRTSMIHLRTDRADSEPRRLIEKWGLWEHKSDTKFVPDWVFRLTRQKTALFLNRLWATDGCVLYQKRAAYQITYSSLSLRLIRDIQRLLWKFGVPTGVREYVPELYKGTDRVAYVLRILTKEGISTFLKEIGALGKSENVPAPRDSYTENNNQDTLPIEVNGLIRDILASHPNPGELQGCKATRSLSKAGLRRTLKYPPTRRKVLEYVAFFREDTGFSSSLVDKLESLTASDIFWDEIVSIEDLGKQWCYDISVGETENFIAQGFITHNSTMLGNRALSFMALVPNITILYVSPTQTQTKTFSVDRISEPMRLSNILQSFASEQQISNVFHKKFLNGAEIKLRNAYLNADRVRGIASDFILLDEIQDIMTDNIPVIEESASHSEFKMFSYSGTPKTMDNPLEYYWLNRSTQNEWVIPCKHHGLPNRPDTWYWNVPTEANIGLQGLICDKCGQRIDASDPDCQWASMNPTPRVNGTEISEPFEGFHVPQIIVPWMKGEKEWGDILYKQATYSRTKFYNEVLGLSFDSGAKPLTQEDLIKNCSEHRYGFSQNWEESKRYLRSLSQQIGGGHRFFVGIDWGTGENSFTVVSIGCYMEPGNRFTYVYSHRFSGPESEPTVRMQLLMELLDTVGFDVLMADYGGGFDPNDALIRKYGRRKIYKCQYSMPAEIVRWEAGLDRFLLHRSEVMSSYFSALKRGTVFRFPAWSVYEHPYAQDHLNIFSEYNERTRLEEYKHSPAAPDDSCHANIYAFMASTLRVPRPDVFSPTGA